LDELNLKVITLPETNNVPVGALGTYKIRPEDTLSHVAAWSTCFAQQTLYPNCIADIASQNLNVVTCVNSNFDCLVEFCVSHIIYFNYF